ncbi:MAG TPA: hypothetical protein VNL16_07070 [Chloroflexota bacterium]|nr:hypothetical protein [Chloroflexota bacterium]
MRRFSSATLRLTALAMILGFVVACGLPPSSRTAVRSSPPVPAVATAPPAAPAPPAVTPAAAAAFFEQVRAAHPDAAWPHWFADKQLAWSAVGLDGGGVEGLVATDGTFSPNANSLGISFWLRDDETGHLYVPRPGTVTQSLDGNQRPLITSQWTAGPATLTATIFAASTGPEPIQPTAGADRLVLAAVSLRAAGPARPWTLYVAVRPFGPAGGVSPLDQVAVTSTTLSANGALTLVAQQPATRFGALDESAVDASVVAASGGQLAAGSATSPHGLAEGLLGYDLSLGDGHTASYAFALPMDRVTASPAFVDGLRQLDVRGLRERVASAWQERLHQVELSVGDPDVANAFYASLAYMLMARQGNLLFSGPLGEHAFYMRDAAYVTRALDQSGQGELVEPMLRLMISDQLPSGRYPPIIEPDGKPLQPLRTEWDSQGEVIFALVEHARLTNNLAFLRSVYPSIRQAAVFQRDQLNATRTAALRGTPFYGILPAGESAEDLLDPTWHHYWDDFWAMTGFQEAAGAAHLLGHDDDATWMTAEENALRQAVLAGVDQTKTADGLAFIPNGPEDTHSTAMARSGTPAIWPVAVLDPKDPLVQHTFEAYYQWTIKPYGGAYRHYGDNYWPYAGLSLAHAFYQLGMMDHTWSVLQWTFAHQTAPHLYTWAEAVNPTNFSFASGDMPHSWMSAEMILLLRDMLLREQGNQLAIGPFPDAWLGAGQRVQLQRFPTQFGTEGYTMTRSADGRQLQLTLSGTPPPGGYSLTVPSPLTIQSEAIDGGPIRTVSGATVGLPSGTRSVTLEVAEPP